MESGAVGFLLKDAPAAELAVALRRVMKGERVVDPDLALAALSEGNNPLTNREREVLRLLVDGATNRVIADQLSVSIETVKSHVHHIMQKLQVKDRTQAAVLAARKQWV